MVHDEDLLLKSVEDHPKVYYKKTYADEESGQEIIYIQVKK